MSYRSHQSCTIGKPLWYSPDKIKPYVIHISFSLFMSFVFKDNGSAQMMSHYCRSYFVFGVASSAIVEWQMWRHPVHLGNLSETCPDKLGRNMAGIPRNPGHEVYPHLDASLIRGRDTEIDWYFIIDKDNRGYQMYANKVWYARQRMWHK